MSIRYTIRHNIPHEKIEAEDVNDSSTWDLNLIRKHELAETDEHDIVYRQHDGKIVSWAKAATQHAQEISDQVDERFNEITTEAALLELKLQEVEEEASALTEEAHGAVESANIAIIKAETAKQESETNAENSEQNYFLAKDWATKTNGKVIENEEEVDYSSKYYAQQAASSAQSASNYASQAQQAATTSAEQAAQNVSDLLSGYVTSAQASASTATEKAEEASESASDALQAKQDAISASGDAISARNTAIDAKDTAVSAANSASNSATSAQTSASSASSSAATAANKATSASNSATTATTKATEASESATSASASATSAQTSANTASAKATEASGFASNAQESANDSQGYSDLSKDWATKTDGMVGSEDYSSKYYAQQAEDAAERTVEDTQQLLQTYVVSASNGATIASNKAGEAQQILEEIESRKDYYGIPIGYEYFSMNPNVPQGSLPLLGGEYDRSTYQDLWEWVQQQTGYLKTEAEWQALSTANNGNVPYYSDGDGSTTFRVPSLRCWVKGTDGSAQLVGSYLAAGLPNITTSTADATQVPFGIKLYKDNPVEYHGALGISGSYYARMQTGGTGEIAMSSLVFNARNSNSIYGNASTVQPESIVGMWLVKAYGTIVDTGSIDEQQYIDDRIATRLSVMGGTLNGSLYVNGAVLGRGFSETAPNLFVIGNMESNDSGYTGLYGSDSYYDGATIFVYGKNNSIGAGRFDLDAYDGTTRKALIGTPQGNLTWDGKEVERVVSKGTYYIRFESGLQIVWGSTLATTAGKTVTFPVAFANTYYAVIPQSSGSSLTAGFESKTTTSVVIQSSHATVQAGIDYICIGRWK